MEAESGRAQVEFNVRGKRQTEIRKWFPRSDPDFYECALWFYCAMIDGPVSANKIARSSKATSDFYLKNFTENGLIKGNKVILPEKWGTTEFFLAVGCGLGQVLRKNKAKNVKA